MAKQNLKLLEKQFAAASWRAVALVEAFKGRSDPTSAELLLIDALEAFIDAEDTLRCACYAERAALSRGQ